MVHRVPAIALGAHGVTNKAAATKMPKQNAAFANDGMHVEARMELTGALCRAARALVQWPREQLAEASGVSKKAIRDFETGDANPGKKERAALKHALETAGAVFLDEDDMGAGVRLRFTRRDVKQLNRLEGEGGVVGDDDV